MKTIYFCTTNKWKNQKIQREFSHYKNDILIEIISFEANEIQNIDNSLVSEYKVK